jgi:hypothetical protein
MRDDVVMLYNEVVDEAEQTGYGCPTQWEGKLKDGRSFYFRYRGGTATLGIGANIDEAIGDAKESWLAYGDALDGILEESAFKDVFGLLYLKHEDLNKWVVTSARVFINGEVGLEVWGTFLSKLDADLWVEQNLAELHSVGNHIQVKELRPVGDE